MANVIQRVEYFKIQKANKPGEGARALEPFREAGVNLLAFKGFPRRRSWQMDFVPEDPVAFRTVAKRAGLKLSPSRRGFLVQGEDRPGVIADLMAPLAKAKINVIAIDAVSAGEGRYGAIFWVRPQDVAKAAKAVGVL